MKLTLMNPDEVASWLGAACAAARKRQRWTQADLAERSGVSLGTVKRLERNGHVDVRTLAALLGTLGLLDPLEQAFETTFRPTVSPLAVRAAVAPSKPVQRVRHARAAA